MIKQAFRSLLDNNNMMGQIITKLCQIKNVKKKMEEKQFHQHTTKDLFHSSSLKLISLPVSGSRDVGFPESGRIVLNTGECSASA